MRNSFINCLTNAYKQVTIGDPIDPQNLMGPLVNQAAVAAYSAAIKLATDQGGEILFGGKVLSQPGFFVEPTILAQVKNTWDIVQEETFAPILYVMPFSKLNEAIAMQNGVKQGLSSALFTTNF